MLPCAYPGVCPEVWLLNVPVRMSRRSSAGWLTILGAVLVLGMSSLWREDASLYCSGGLPPCLVIMGGDDGVLPRWLGRGRMIAWMGTLIFRD